VTDLLSCWWVFMWWAFFHFQCAWLVAYVAPGVGVVVAPGVGVTWLNCAHRCIKKNIADLSHKISELASHPNGDSQLMDQLSDELQVQQDQLKQTK